MHTDTTICALSSPPGRGAIALIRVSGKDSVTLVDQITSFRKKGKKLIDQKANTIHFAEIIDNDQPVDEVVISLFKSPNSYTGEDLVEISCHGSTVIQLKILELLSKKGAQLAKPGEFTQRAFLNGKMDLSQAEGVADLIASGSAAAHKLALTQMRGGFSSEINKLRSELLEFISLIELELDFSEEDVEFADRQSLKKLTDKISQLLESLISSFEYGNAMKNGVPVAIIGPTNAGKSTLLNRLLNEEKAIVSEIAGTTRDFIEDTMVIDGILFRFIDTAGLRHAVDSIETEGIQRSMKKFEQASIVIILIDPAERIEELANSLAFLSDESLEGSKKTIILTLNKIDLLPAEEVKLKLKELTKLWNQITLSIAISAGTGEGVKELEHLLVKEATKGHSPDQDIVVTNVRHFEALNHANKALLRAKEGLISGLPSDLLAQDIREVMHYLGEITGDITTDEILGNIFRNFCIGK